MTVLTIALIIMIGFVNLHCLFQIGKQKSSVTHRIDKSEATEMTIHIGLVPGLHLDISFDYR